MMDRIRLNRGSLLFFLFKQKMASAVTIDNIQIRNSVGMFCDPIEFSITFSLLQSIQRPLQWKIIYVGSAKDENYDQILEDFEIGPLEEHSVNQFQVQCTAPDYTKIPQNELISLSAILLTVSYKDQQFLRVGYYVYNQQNTLHQNNIQQIPLSTLVTSIKRTIIVDKPRVTKFGIQWDNPNNKKQEITESPQSQLLKQLNSGQQSEQVQKNSFFDQSQQSQEKKSQKIESQVSTEQKCL